VAPNQGPSILQPALCHLLGLLEGGTEPDTVVAAALGVLARLLLHAPGNLPPLLQARQPTASAEGKGEARVSGTARALSRGALGGRRRCC
jgi:hypothetical protein